MNRIEPVQEYVILDGCRHPTHELIRNLPRMTQADADTEINRRWIAGRASLGRIIRVTDLTTIRPFTSTRWALGAERTPDTGQETSS